MIVKELNEIRDMLDFSQGCIKNYKAYCYKCGGSGEIPSNAFDEPPESCPICTPTGLLIDSLAQLISKIERKIHSLHPDAVDINTTDQGIEEVQGPA